MGYFIPNFSVIFVLINFLITLNIEIKIVYSCFLEIKKLTKINLLDNKFSNMEYKNMK